MYNFSTSNFPHVADIALQVSDSSYFYKGGFWEAVEQKDHSLHIQGTQRNSHKLRCCEILTMHPQYGAYFHIINPFLFLFLYLRECLTNGVTVNQTLCGHVSNNGTWIGGFCLDHRSGVVSELLLVHPVHNVHDSLSDCGLSLFSQWLFLTISLLVLWSYNLIKIDQWKLAILWL